MARDLMSMSCISTCTEQLASSLTPSVQHQWHQITWHHWWSQRIDIQVFSTIFFVSYATCLLHNTVFLSVLALPSLPWLLSEPRSIKMDARWVLAQSLPAPLSALFPCYYFMLCYMCLSARLGQCCQSKFSFTNVKGLSYSIEFRSTVQVPFDLGYLDLMISWDVISKWHKGQDEDLHNRPSFVIPAINEFSAQSTTEQQNPLQGSPSTQTKHAQTTTMILSVHTHSDFST